MPGGRNQLRQNFSEMSHKHVIGLPANDCVNELCINF
jgi:hypothetical protein